MAIHFGALGPLARDAWEAMALGSPGSAAPRAIVRQWRSVDGMAQLGIAEGECSRGRSALSESADQLFVAAGVGSLEGTGDQDIATTVLQAWQRGGFDALRRLRGTYAVAVWDARERSLVVACDALGLCAPAYRWDGRTFVFATRAMALAGTSDTAWNGTYVAHALSGILSSPTDATAFRGVSRLAAGEILRVTDGCLVRLPGDRLAFNSDAETRGREPAVRTLGHRLDRAVETRRRGAGRVCVALSGGIDSCVVASSLLRHAGSLECLSLVVGGASCASPAPIDAVERALPRAVVHRIEVAYTGPNLFDSLPIADDPIYAAPATQRARAMLLRTAREMGHDDVFDGEGSDELFDIAWRPVDLARQASWGPLVRGLVLPGSRRRLADDLFWSAASGLSGFRDWHIGRLARRLPWLRRAFWRETFLRAAWQEATTYLARRSAADRLADVLGAHARYWRAQELLRDSAGIAGQSPFLDRAIVEFVGSLPARDALHRVHRKPLVRALAEERVRGLNAWCPKREPLNDWLVGQVSSDPACMSIAVERIRRSSLLSEWVDPGALEATALRPSHHAADIVQLFAFVEWADSVERRFG